MMVTMSLCGTTAFCLVRIGDWVFGGYRTPLGAQPQRYLSLSTERSSNWNDSILEGCFWVLGYVFLIPLGVLSVLGFGHSWKRIVVS